LPESGQLGHRNHAELWEGLKGCLSNLVKIRPRLQSFSFGRTNASAGDRLMRNDSPCMRVPDVHLDDEQELSSVFRSIRHLSLPVEIVYYDEGNLEHYRPTLSTRRLLSYCTATLTHLNLETRLYSGLLPRYLTYSMLESKFKPAFAEILSQMHFQALTSVVLRGWMFPLKDLESFLLAHAKTLRNMHLINCCLAEASEEELKSSVRTNLQPALALTGVEIYALVYDENCLARHLKLVRQRPSPMVTYPKVQFHRDDLEELFLGGRPNAVTRAELKNSDRLSCRRWWGEPDEDIIDDELNFPAPRKQIDIC